jgi:hypothetical protein
VTPAARRELYGIAEIADALGLPRQLVTVWRRRRTRGMPEPDAELASGPVWAGATIEPWIDGQLAARDTDAAPLDPATVRRFARRLLRLIALLLEEPRRPRLVHQALREVAELLPVLESAEQDAVATALAAVAAPVAERVDDPRALLAALVARLPTLAEALTEVLTGAEPASDR